MGYYSGANNTGLSSIIFIHLAVVGFKIYS